MIGGLVDYGIQNEQSDIRAHVCAKIRTVYVFPTAAGLEAIKQHPEVKPVPAYQEGIVFPTAWGYPMPWQYIPKIRHLEFFSWTGWADFNGNLPLGERGSRAVECVLEIMRIGRFPFWIKAKECLDSQVQLTGTDILVQGTHRVQVKCDYPGGDKAKGGTGNLYLQIKERNPFSIH